MIARIAFLFALVAAPATAEPLIFDNGRLFIPATLNGLPAEGLLDSGAEATLAGPQLAAAAKLGPGKEQTIRGTGGTAKARIVEGATLSALGIEMRPEMVVVMDLSDLSKRLIKRETQLVLGRELFDATRLRIDIPGRKIEAVERNAIPAGKRLALTAHAGIEAIPAVANGRPVQAEFDLGNGSDVLISRALANKLGLKVVGKKAGGGVGGAVTRDLVRLHTLSVAGMRFRNVTAAVDDQPNANDLNIGTSILKNFLITTDFRERAVWLEPVGTMR